MSVINETIIHFLQQQTCATICCTNEQGIPYCFSCYYELNPGNGLLYFKSSENAHHSALLATNPVVAGTILPDKLNKLVVWGIQFQGEVVEPLPPLVKDASAFYHKNNSIALAIKGKVFTIRLTSLKMTDNRIGFGKKIVWERNEPEKLIDAKK